MGTDGALVALTVFKTARGRLTVGWLGSIPRRSRYHAVLRLFIIDFSAVRFKTGAGRTQSCQEPARHVVGRLHSARVDPIL